jgi:hypothetical protein
MGIRIRGIRVGTTRKCEYARSDMTPCVIRDGDICYAEDGRHRPICVGCERTPEQTGVPRPKDWNKIVRNGGKRGNKRR